MIFKTLTATATALGLTMLAAASAHAQGTSARILMFHDVSFTDGKVSVSDDVYPDNFRDMMEFLDRNYNVISMDQFIAWRQGSGSIPTNAVVITFDDNYMGTHDFARPIMGELDQVGINFAHTAFVGVLTSKDHADWNELREEELEGILQVESHTVTHPNLTQVGNSLSELTASKAAIEAQIPGKTVRYIAYPFGGYNSTIISQAQSAGYIAGVTTLTGLNTMSTPFFELRRNGVGNNIRLSEFKTIMGYGGSDASGPKIIDNNTTGFTTTGTWSLVGSRTTNYGHYGETYRRATRSASQTATARYTPSLTAGFYDVFSHHTSEADPYQTTADATYRIVHKGGTTNRIVNQRINKAEWFHLGRFEFNGGTGGYVEISNQGSTGSFVGADAIKFQPVSSSAPLPLAPIIVDNTAGGFSTTGSWLTSTSGEYFGTNNRLALGGNGSPTATATFSVNVPRAGYYDIGVWYTTSNATFRSNSVPVTISHAAGLETVTVNQQSTGIGAKRFNSLGTFRLNAGQQSLVTISNAIPSTTQYVSADAIRVDWVADTGVAPLEVVVDNTDAGFNASSNWFATTSMPGYLGSNYRARLTASLSDAATWSANLPQSGAYQVYARWTTGSNRATAAPYVVYHAGGSTTVPVNQQLNNGAWVSLGSFNFNAGTATRVALSCWTSSGQYVIADAIKLVKQ